MNGEPTRHARTAADWRAWLDEHAALQRAIIGAGTIADGSTIASALHLGLDRQR